LCQHAERNASDLVLLPEFAMVDPVWESEFFDRGQWAATETLSDLWLQRLGELQAAYVVGSRPVSINEGRFNQGYIWSATRGLVPLRRKFFLPAEAGNWETTWFDRGDQAFPVYQAGPLAFGLNICTELWALDTYAAYAARGAQVILSPRATAAATTEKWLSVGVVAAVRSGAFSLSSNRVDPTGACGGVGWIISPNGKILATTSAEAPFATVSIDLAAPITARYEYPRYIFAGNSDDSR
jgi:N-carbamoylputrescine amidase